MKNNCGCLGGLLTFPKSVTKLDFIKDWIDWAEPLIKEIDTKASDLETWKEGADADIADIQGQLGTFALKGHSHDSILDADTESSINISGGVLGISLDDPNTGTGGDIYITANSISNLQRAISDPDTEPTEDSNALITSGAVYEALQDIPSSPTDNIISENGTGLSVVDGAFNGVIKDGTTTKYITVNKDNADNLNNALNNPDTVPTSGSSRLITSGGVYYALSQIEPSTTSIPIVYRVLDDSFMNPPTIEIDSLFPVGGSNRVTLIIRNATSSVHDVIDLNNGYLYSDSGYPVHMAQPFNTAQTSENTIPEGGYMILNLYKIDLATFKDEGAETLGSKYAYHSVDHGSDPDLPTCYFITLGGVFEPVA